jgi:hypothetical protein
MDTVAELDVDVVLDGVIWSWEQGVHHVADGRLSRLNSSLWTAYLWSVHDRWRCRLRQLLSPPASARPETVSIWAIGRLRDLGVSDAPILAGRPPAIGADQARLDPP